jgi:hypothetical protein
VHLLNGDLSYANVNQANMPAVWADFANNTMASAMNQPWMPALGNHEIEAGNGPLGYLSYQTRYSLPHGEQEAAANETEVATWSAVRDPDTTHPWGIDGRTGSRVAAVCG